MCASADVMEAEDMDQTSAPTPVIVNITGERDYMSHLTIRLRDYMSHLTIRLRDSLLCFALNCMVI